MHYVITLIQIDRCYVSLLTAIDMKNVVKMIPIELSYSRKLWRKERQKGHTTLHFVLMSQIHLLYFVKFHRRRVRSGHKSCKILKVMCWPMQCMYIDSGALPTNGLWFSTSFEKFSTKIAIMRRNQEHWLWWQLEQSQLYENEDKIDENYSRKDQQSKAAKEQVRRNNDWNQALNNCKHDGNKCKVLQTVDDQGEEKGKSGDYPLKRSNKRRTVTSATMDCQDLRVMKSLTLRYS